jgi:hypothetical protein
MDSPASVCDVRRVLVRKSTLGVSEVSVSRHSCTSSTCTSTAHSESDEGLFVANNIEVRTTQLPHASRWVVRVRLVARCSLLVARCSFLVVLQVKCLPLSLCTLCSDAAYFAILMANSLSLLFYSCTPAKRETYLYKYKRAQIIEHQSEAATVLVLVQVLYCTCT